MAHPQLLIISRNAVAEGDFITNNSSRDKKASLEASQATPGIPEVSSDLWETKVNGLDQIIPGTEYNMKNKLNLEASGDVGVTADAQGQVGPPRLFLKIKGLIN